jgi:hypothetical protein
MVSRRKLCTWETEALVHAEILRAALDSLGELKSAIDRGDSSGSAVVLGNASQVTTRSAIWLTEWKNRCVKDSATESVAFNSYAACLPALAYCIDVCRWSLGILTTAPERDTVARELALRGVATAQAVSLFALECVHATQNPRRQYRAMSEAGAQALGVQMKPLEILGAQILAVAGQPRSGVGAEE